MTIEVDAAHSSDRNRENEFSGAMPMAIRMVIERDACGSGEGNRENKSPGAIQVAIMKAIEMAIAMAIRDAH